MQVEELLDKLEEVTERGDNEWTARCPAHQDENPSLSVAAKDGKILLFCHAGCQYSQIIHELGIQSSELNPSMGCTLEEYCKAKKLNPNILREECGVYEFEGKTGLPALVIPYYDLDGETVIWKRLRTALKGKDRFRTVAGSEPVLYGLQHLAKAPSSIFLVEGESDAHVLWQHEIPAVGVPGAANFKDSWVPLFDGVETIYVVVEPDQGGTTLKAALQGTDLEPRICFVTLPNGYKDICEMYLADINTLEERLDAVIAGFDLISLGEGECPPPMEYVIDEVIPEGFISAIFGTGNTGKSYLAMYTAMCVALNLPWFGRTVKQGNVLYADAELDEQEMKRRAWQVARGLGLERPPHNLYYYRLKGGILTRLEDLATKRRRHNISLIIVDSLTIGLGALAINESKEIIPAMEVLEGKLGTTLVLDHVPKGAPGMDPSMITQIGSVFKRNMARSSIKLRQEGGTVLVTHDKHNFGPMFKTFGYIPEFEGKYSVKFEEASKEQMQQARAAMGSAEQIESILEEKGKVKVADLMKHFGKTLSRGQIYNILGQLQSKGVATHDVFGYWVHADHKPDEGEPTEAEFDGEEPEADTELKAWKLA